MLLTGTGVGLVRINLFILKKRIEQFDGNVSFMAHNTLKRNKIHSLKPLSLETP